MKKYLLIKAAFVAALTVSAVSGAAPRVRAPALGLSSARHGLRLPVRAGPGITA